jgi:hypothetical protein
MKKNTEKKKKIKVKNTVPHLLSAAMNHEDCPNWLKGLIWNTFNDNADMPADTPEFYAQCIKYSRLSDIDANETESANADAVIVSESGARTEVRIVEKPGKSTELEKLAVQISEVMKNPLTPTNLYNVMSDELSHVIGFADSPEWILGNLKQQSSKE